MVREPQRRVTQLFRDAALERAYGDETARQVLRNFRLFTGLALVGFLANWFADPVMTGSAANAEVVRHYRLAFGAAPLALIVALGYGPARWFRHAWQTAYVLAGAILILVPALAVARVPDPERLDVAALYVTAIVAMFAGGISLPVGTIRAACLGVTVGGAMLALITYGGWKTVAGIQMAVVISVAMEVLVAYQLNQRDRQAFAASFRLEQERARSERLLLNVLPAPIAARLKAGTERIADSFAEATVLFADIVGFTTWSQQLAPEQIVAALDDLFSGFDDIAARHGLEKIKTIGDAYMVVGGMPTARPDHAVAVAAMALDMRDLVASRRFGAAHQLELRIGIHTGPVVAGVIGKQKFIYDLWGDTVNTASRMESHGVAGGIQVSAETHAKLRESFELESRGVVAIKGKGDVATWLLVGRRAQAAA